MLDFKTAAQVLDHGEPVNYRKTASARAVEAKEPFTITTTVDGKTETFREGKAGDFICIGVTGEVWRVEREIFLKTYQPIKMIEYPVKKGVYVGNAWVDYDDDFFEIRKVEFGYLTEHGDWFSPGFPHLVLQTEDSVAMVVYNIDTHTIELVNQLRIAVYDWCIELPAGTIEGTPLSSALRETQEELGYKVGIKNKATGLYAPASGVHVERLGTFPLSPGRISEKIHIFYIEVTNQMQTGKPVGVKYEGEHIEPLRFELWEAEQKIKDGEITDLKTAYGINWLCKQYR